MTFLPLFSSIFMSLSLCGMCMCMHACLHMYVDTCVGAYVCASGGLVHTYASLLMPCCWSLLISSSTLFTEARPLSQAQSSPICPVLLAMLPWESLVSTFHGWYHRWACHATWGPETWTLGRQALSQLSHLYSRLACVSLPNWKQEKLIALHLERKRDSASQVLETDRPLIC